MNLPPATIFFEFQLPNATTWFYFSFLLTVALFFKFSRFLSVRNWDVISLFLLVPGLLLLQEANAMNQPSSGGNGGKIAHQPANAALPRADQLRAIGYIWLVAGSGYYFLRCLLDLALVRRPALTANLTPGGLAWLEGALFIGLVYVAVRPPDEIVGKKSVITGEMASQVETAAGGVAGREGRFWLESGLAIASHLAVIAGLIVIGRRHFQDTEAGIAAATLYLLLPYTAMFVGQFHHVLPTALLVWAVVFYWRPSLAGLLLGLAAGSQYFPALVFGVWCSFYWRRGAGRFAAAFGLAFVFSLAVGGILLFIQGDLAKNLKSVLALSDWQAWKAPTPESFWTGVHWAYRLPVFIGYLAFLVITSFWPAPKNLAHVLALSAAALIGIQFWYADQGGVYVLWYLPLLLMLVFRPNLSDRLPNPMVDEADWLGKTTRLVRRMVSRARKQPEPAVKVP